MLWASILFDALIGDVQFFEGGDSQTWWHLNQLVPLQVNDLKIGHVVERVVVNQTNIAARYSELFELSHGCQQVSGDSSVVRQALYPLDSVA